MAAPVPGAAAAVCLFAPRGPYGAPGLGFLQGMDEFCRQEVQIFFAGRRRETLRMEVAEMYQRAG